MLTVKELIEKLQKFPPDMEVWSFDYGDSQPYPIANIILQKTSEADGDYFVGHDVVLMR